LLEVPSYLILWPALVYIGRKKSLVALYLTCAVCIFAVMAIILVYPGGESGVLGGYTVWAPAALFGTVSLISAVLSLILPETRHCTLPESNDFFSKKKDKETDRGGSKETSLEDVSQGVVNLSYNPETGQPGTERL
ncbi:putative Organic cation transporter protein-like 26, partial [Homarus americanus]